MLPAGGNFGADGGDRGPAVLFKDVVEVVRKTGPEEIAHFNLQPTMDVLANFPGNDLGRVAREIERRMTKLELPKGVRLTVQGEANSMRNAITSFAVTLPMATLLIYLVMVGFSVPFSIRSSSYSRFPSVSSA